jgi:hypothetical protein
MKEHSDLILELPNFIPESLCENIINKFDNCPHKTDGMVEYSGRRFVDKRLKDSEEILIKSCVTSWYEEYFILKKYVYMAVDLYKMCLKNEYQHDQPVHMFNMLPTINVGISNNCLLMQKQARGAKYAWHYDGGIGSRDAFLVIMYLNTLEPDEGGCTEFFNGRKIKPECGKIMVCPASWTYPHSGNEIKGKPKYIVTAITEL